MLRKLHIRAGTKADKDFVYSCVSALLREENKSAPLPDIKAFDETYSRVLSKPSNCPLFIVEKQGEKIGMAACNKIVTLEMGCYSLDVNQMYIKEEHRNKGYGSKLLDFLADYSKEHEMYAIEWTQPEETDEEVRKANKRFLEKHDILEVGPGRRKNIVK